MTETVCCTQCSLTCIDVLFFPLPSHLKQTPCRDKYIITPWCGVCTHQLWLCQWPLSSNLQQEFNYCMIYTCKLMNHVEHSCNSHALNMLNVQPLLFSHFLMHTYFDMVLDKKWIAFFQLGSNDSGKFLLFIHVIAMITCSIHATEWK